MFPRNKNILYAPWRKKYSEENVTKDRFDINLCVFCKPEKDLFVLESKNCFIQANKYPYGTGHLLVIPKRHVSSILDLTTIERIEIFNLIDLSIYALKIYLKPEGFNIGCGIEEVAGTSVQHLHFHVLSRFTGDVGWNRIANFQLLSISPKDLTIELRKIITKNKLKKKFNII